MIRQVVAKNWVELNEALYDECYDETLRRYRSPFAYRGMNRDYSLFTSLMRLVPSSDYRRLGQLERALIRNFQKYGHQEGFEKESVWHVLSVAQHHGLPTRILDWTYSPFVAMHFATADMGAYGEDGVIWCVNFMEAQRYLPLELRKVLECESTNVFTVEMLRERFQDLHQFDAPAAGEFLLFFEPPSLDQRIVNQVALFSFFSNLERHLDDWLQEKAGAHPALCKKIIIPHEAKWEVRDKLDQANINERILFPGLDGLSAWLKRYYSPKP